MNPQHEVAIRTAVDELVAALLAAVRAEVALVPTTCDRLLSIDEAAETLGIGRTALYQELSAGRLRSFKVGRRRLISTSAINAYIGAATMSRGRDQDDVMGSVFLDAMVATPMLGGSLAPDSRTRGRLLTADSTVPTFDTDTTTDEGADLPPTPSGSGRRRTSGNRRAHRERGKHPNAATAETSQAGSGNG
jgi:excisionase family DNA binding protein